jgi:hypothetical protein
MRTRSHRLKRQVLPTPRPSRCTRGRSTTVWNWEPRRRLTSGRITVLAVFTSVVLAAAAAVIAFTYLRDDEPAPAGVASPTATPAPPAVTPPPITITQAAPPPPAPVQNRPPAPVVLPSRAGSVWVRTQSGKTICQVTAGEVGCDVDFSRPTPIVNGLPASGVSVTARGNWEWLVGDPGDPDYETLGYGTTYRALGWTITPTSEGTTFINDATGHGMTVSVEGFSPF